MLGRLLGGISTSLLFSVFDAWLIRSHADADLPRSLLSKSFSTAAFGNSIVAIVAGLVGNKIAKSEMRILTGNFYVGQYLNPFDLAILSLTLCGIGAAFMWEENYGHSDSESEEKTHERKGDAKWYGDLQDALVATIRNRDILLCGIISSLFEGSMYSKFSLCFGNPLTDTSRPSHHVPIFVVFVFMWTPLMMSFIEDKANESLPFGTIFSTFMVFCMAGSSLFSILVGKFSVEKLGVGIFAVSAVAMICVALQISATASFMGMNVFEICVGMYFPIMGTMKGSIVPEDKRAAIYNLYRIPLNFIVVLSLLTDLSPSTAFAINVVMMMTATFLQFILTMRRKDSNEASERFASKDERVESLPLMSQDGSSDVV